MSITKVTKRSGRVVPFDRRRIEKAVYAAARAVGNGGGKSWAETIAWAVTGILEERFGQNGRPPHVEEIQDVVEEVLIKSGHPQVAKAYILYRQKRAEARATERMLMDTEKLVDDYLQKLDWRVNENSNMNYSLQGLNFYLASSIAARYWLHKTYPPEVQQAHSDGEMHIHDLGMLSGYTYYGKEVVVFRDAAGIRLTSFEQLYSSCTEPEVSLNEADGAFVKFPQDGFVLDKDGWTRVLRLVRKSKNRPMRFIKNRGGRSVIVTDNHPMVTRNGEILADAVEPRADALYTADLCRLLSREDLFSESEIDLLAELHQAGVNQFGRDRVYFNGVPLADLDFAQAGEGVIHTPTRTIPRRIPLTTELGYFVGFVLAEGYLSYDTDTPRTISVTQKDASLLHETNRALIALGIPGCISRSKSSDMYDLQIKNVFLRFLFEHVFGIQPGARHKSLPLRTLHYNPDFVKGILAGVVDGDGSAGDGRTSIIIRVSARTLLEQMAYVLHLLGATPRDRNIEGVGTSRRYKGREIVQRFPLYGLSFRKTADLVLPSSLFQSAAVSSSAWQDETRGEWHVVLNNEPTDTPDDEIYDITTESGTLIVNGMWNHNCAGWDLQDLLVQGFGGVPAKIESRPPKHLRTALGQLVNFFYTLQGEVAGAVAVSNFDTLLAPFIRYDRLDYTGVKQAVQEFVYNINVPTRVGFQSLVWEELVLVRRNGRIEPVEIGQVVDEQFERNRHRVLTQGADSFAVANADDVQAVAFDAAGSVRWVPVKAFVRHRVPQGSTFVRMRTSRGTAAVSQAHSMFAFEKLNGRLAIRPVAAHQVEVAHGNASLTPTNHLVAVRRAPNGGTRARLDLAELLDGVPQLADRVRVRLPEHPAAVERLKARAQERFGGLTAFYLEYGLKDKGSWRQWAANRSIPYRVWRDLGQDEPAAELSLRNSKLWYARALEGNRLVEFIRLLGWYITEGHNDISNGLYVSQARGGDQDEMVRVLGALGALGRIEEMGGWSAQGNPTRPVLRMAGKGLLAALIGFLGGTYSTNKVIPWFIYDLTHDLQEEFITTLLRGDGSEFPGYWDYTTTSKRLSLGLSLLLAMNGYKFSVYETPGKSEAWSDQYTLRIQKDKAAGEGYAIGDLLGRICNRRETFAYEREYEYDLSVDTPLENFCGGSGLLCFHNTPFTNVTMDLAAPSTLRDQAVVIGGKPQEATYGEFQEEMDLLNRAFAEVMLEGDSRNRVMTFPIPTFNVTRDFDWDNPVLEPVWTMTAKYGIPYFCLEEDTAVLAKDRRPVPIKQVRVDDHLIGSHGDPVRVTAVFHQQSPEIVRITLGSGEVVLATPTHKFPTDNGLREAARLALGDRLVRSQAPGYEPIVELRLEQGKFAVVDVAVDSDDHLFTLAAGILSHNSNYINSDMNPEDARSMCPLHPDTLVPIQVDGAIAVRPICEIFDRYRDRRPRVLNGGWHEALPVATPTQGCLELGTANGVRTTMDIRHEQPVKCGRGQPVQLLTAAQIRPGMYLPFSAPKNGAGDEGYCEEGFYWYPVDTIRDIAHDGPVYCFAVDSEEHLFQTANGLITHNCRLRLDNRELRKRAGGLFAAAPLTGSAGVVTINMPRLAYQSHDEADFQGRLEKLMETGRTSLEIKRKMLEQLTDRGLYPYSRHYLRAVKSQTGGYWSHHFSTIGLIGMNEACLNLIGMGISHPEGKALAVRTLEFMREVLTRFQLDTGNLYNLEATPAEGASYRLARADKKEWPDIITAGTEQTPYYTNSTHLPVGFSDDLFSVLDHQDDLQTLYTGGTVLHIFLGERLHDWRQARKLVRTVAENYRLPYFTLTPTFSICPVHGYIAGEHKYCPYEHTQEQLERYGVEVQK